MSDISDMRDMSERSGISAMSERSGMSDMSERSDMSNRSSSGEVSRRIRGQLELYGNISESWFGDFLSFITRLFQLY